MIGLPYREKILTIRMETIQQRVRQSDGHRATAKTAFTHSVSRQKLVTAHQRQELCWICRMQSLCKRDAEK